MPYAFYLHGGGDVHIHAYDNAHEFYRSWGGSDNENVLVGSRKNMDYTHTHIQYEVDNYFLTTILVSKEWVHSQST